MRPEWFNVHEIPYHSMWEDDSLWYSFSGTKLKIRLPSVIQGEDVHWTFWFDEAGKVLKSVPYLYEKEDWTSAQ